MSSASPLNVSHAGQEIFVGESLRSNKAGAESLQRAFPEFPVTQVPIRGTLHLKSVATLAQDGVLLVSDSKAGQEVLKVSSFTWFLVCFGWGWG